MQTRELGGTGQESSILTFGAIALDYLGQDRANELAETVLEAGVNHFDVAPTYGDAEVKLAPTLAKYREEIFLGCKTQERTYYGAWGELHRSLDRLGVDSIDLYQFHAVTGYNQLEAIQGSYTPEMAQEDDPGALQAFREAKAEGLIDHIGLTSHGDPALIRKAIKEIPDLEAVMFPFNAIVATKGAEAPEYDYASVLQLARDRGLGTLCIKGFAKGPWPDDLPEEDRPYENWYEPYDTEADIEEALRFSLTYGVSSVVSAGDPKLVSMIVEAAEAVEPMSEAELEAAKDRVRDRESPVPALR